MPKLVNSSWFTPMQEGFIVNSRKKTSNQQPATSNRNSTGLTLVELLVVIAILGILASFTSFALIGHQKKARDAQRKSDMQVFKKTMELAKSNCRNSAYYIGQANGNVTAGQGPAGNFSQMISRLNTSGYKISVADPLNPSNDYNKPPYYGLMTETAPGNGYLNACPTTPYLGKEYFIAWTTLEISNDKDAASSMENCTETKTRIGLNVAFWKTGNYYVCSE